MIIEPLTECTRPQSDQDHGSGNAGGRQRTYTSGAAAAGGGQFSSVGGEAQGQEVTSAGTIFGGKAGEARAKKTKINLHGTQVHVP